MKHQIYIIEDNPKWRMKLVDTVNRSSLKNDFSIEIFEEGNFDIAEEVLLTDASRFSVIITDLYPSEDINDGGRDPKGLEYIKHIQECRLSIPIIVVSGDTKKVKQVLRERLVISAFDKTAFERLEFVSAIRKSLEIVEANLGTPPGDKPQNVNETDIRNESNGDFIA